MIVIKVYFELNLDNKIRIIKAKPDKVKCLWENNDNFFFSNIETLSDEIFNRNHDNFIEKYPNNKNIAMILSLYVSSQDLTKNIHEWDRKYDYLEEKNIRKYRSQIINKIKEYEDLISLF